MIFKFSWTKCWRCPFRLRVWGRPLQQNYREAARPQESLRRGHYLFKIIESKIFDDLRWISCVPCFGFFDSQILEPKKLYLETVSGLARPRSPEGAGSVMSEAEFEQNCDKYGCKNKILARRNVFEVEKNGKQISVTGFSRRRRRNRDGLGDWKRFM